MKPYYSIEELACILSDDIHGVKDGLAACGVAAFHNGERDDLSGWRRPLIDHGNGNITITTGLAISPHPNTVIVSSGALPESWRKRIETSEHDTARDVSVETDVPQAESTASAVRQEDVKTKAKDRFNSALRILLDEISEKCKNKDINFKSMPGTCANLYELAGKKKYFPTYSLSTFKKYQKASGICSFASHAESSSFYKAFFD